MGKFQEEKEQLWFLDMVVHNEKAYFSAGWFNGLIEADMTTGEAEVIAKFPNERGLVGDLHQEMIYSNGKIYFCPRSTDWLYIYDLNKKEMKAVALPENEHYWQNRETKFGKAVLRDNYLYLFPMNYNQILRFDIAKEEFAVYDDWFIEFQNLKKYEETPNTAVVFFSFFMMYENACVWSMCGTNIFCIFDTNTGKVAFKEHACGNIVSIEKKEKPFFVCEDARCWRYDEEKKEFVYIDTLDINTKEIFTEFIINNERCYFPSLIKNELLIYDMKTKNRTRIEFETDGREYKNAIGSRWKRPLLFVRYADNNMYLLNQYNELINLDVKSENYDVRRFRLDTDEKIDWDWNLWTGNACCKYTFFPYDSDDPEILMYIMKRETPVAEDEDCGKKIWKCVRECL